ncbi:MAG: membrane protein insertion efficiency factor YidD [Bacteroidetes bacterium]|nr:membrane protein insertion efficiency factor YidD [Bacteroidota bacterium]
MRIFIIILFLLSSVLQYAIAQSPDEIECLKSSFELQTALPYEKHGTESNSAIELVFNQVFIFYKVFISSQDYSSCSFHPSCSEYAIEAIHKQGVVKGVFNTFDRLTRCNGLSPEHYHIHRELHALEDPLRNMRYENIK